MRAGEFMQDIHHSVHMEICQQAMTSYLLCSDYVKQIIDTLTLAIVTLSDRLLCALLLYIGNISLLLVIIV